MGLAPLYGGTGRVFRIFATISLVLKPEKQHVDQG